MLSSERKDQIRLDAGLGRPAQYQDPEETEYRRQVENEEFPEGMVEDIVTDLPDI